MKGYDLILHFEFAESLTHAAVLAHLVEFAGKNENFYDAEFWFYEAAPALLKLMNQIHYHLSSSDDSGDMLSSINGNETIREAARMMTVIAEEIIIACDIFDEVAERLDRREDTE
jgi:hypothetical protein